MVEGPAVVEQDLEAFQKGNGSQGFALQLFLTAAQGALEASYCLPIGARACDDQICGLPTASKIAPGRAEESNSVRECGTATQPRGGMLQLGDIVEGLPLRVLLKVPDQLGSEPVRGCGRVLAWAA
ncbi:hypothetical protein DL769_001306 [Monosporascus sp. CRB-8-3]|nr:hypothetical protein DL769_001306 [Monosporascus sp. CRB-8-3]